jgi:hypothetical protein
MEIYWKRDGITVHHCRFNGSDTDSMVLLLLHIQPTHQNIFMQTSNKTINVKTLHAHLEPDLIGSLLFIHAITGCDTVLRPYSIDKGIALTKYKQIKSHADIFLIKSV